MKNLSFEVHTYAPELNRVICAGADISKMFSDTTLISLAKDYRHNVKVVRDALKVGHGMKMYKLKARRIDGTIETRFCAQPTTKDALYQLRKARAYYAETTELDFKILY